MNSSYKGHKASVSGLASQLDNMKGRLGVSRSGEWEKNWLDTIGMPPQKFYDMLTDSLEGDHKVYIELKGSGMGSISLETKHEGEKVFSADIDFSRIHGTLTIDEVRVEKTEGRRRGTGKQFLANILAVSEHWGLDVIRLRAGREDGPLFWSARGAFLEDSPVLKERFISAVSEAATELDLDEKTRDELEKILGSAGPDMNFNIASMGNKADGKPLAALLLRNTNPRLEFRLKDDRQMSLVKDSIGMQTPG
jgi:hypothetical protein